MLDVRWSTRTQADFERIAAYWREVGPQRQEIVFRAVYTRVRWLADDHAYLGNPIAGMPERYRCCLERRFGYRILYRVEGEPAHTLRILTIRHGRERPLRPSTIRRHAR